MKALSGYSIRDPETMECPYEFYAALRRDKPVYRDAGTGWYIVSRYADIRELLRRPHIFSSKIERLKVHGEGAEEAVRRLYETKGWTPLSILDSDPPTHTDYRQVVNEWFSKQRLATSVPYMTELADAMVDRFINDGECELISQFAIPWPLTVMTTMLGAPEEDHDFFMKWSDTQVEIYGMMISRDRILECSEIGVEMQHYLAALIEERRTKPADDILTKLTQARFRQDRLLTMEEILSFVYLILLAGNHTTTNALSSAIYYLIQQPHLVAKIRDDENLLSTFIEETLRLESPISGEIRIVTEDTSIAGTAIPKGAIVNFRVAAANRDEEQFVDADVLNIDRKKAATHLAFGAGIHHCLGAHLARQELAVGLGVLLRRLDNIAAAPGRNDFRHGPNTFMRGLKHLYITFDSR